MYTRNTLRSRNRASGTLAFGTLLAAIGCTANTTNTKPEPSVPPATDTHTAPLEVVKGLFVIDGTEVADCSKFQGFKSNIKDMELIWGGDIHFCANGPNLAGSDSGPIFSTVMDRICSAARSRGLNSIYLAGYSRGAIIATTIARTFFQNQGQCGGGTRVRPAWLGLMDPNDMAMDGGWARTIPRPGGSPMANLEIVKTDQSFIGAHLLATKWIDGASAEWAEETSPGRGDNRSHANMGWNWKVLQRLLDSGRAAGALFMRPADIKNP
jgi:hypothetical protein